MRRILFIAILIISLYDVSAQIKIESVGPPQPVKLIEKEIYDTAHVTVFYDYGCKDDVISSVPTKRYSEVALLIGEKYVGTMDWRGYLCDSIQDDYSRNNRGSFEEFFNKTFNDERYRSAYRYPLVVNLKTQEATLKLSTFSLYYRYKQQLPNIEWKLENEEKKIKGIRCLKATCRFGGRDWTAWYAPEYAMPYGPYLFQGLPGLIMQVVDTKKNFAFKFKGIEQQEYRRCIYLHHNEKTIITTREKAREAVKNIYKNPIGAMVENGNLPKDNILLNAKKSLPYNPIELE